MNYINKKDFTLEELKFIRALLSVDKFKGFINPTYKSILDKLEYKIDSMINEGVTLVYSDVFKDVCKKYSIK